MRGKRRVRGNIRWQRKNAEQDKIFGRRDRTMITTQSSCYELIAKSRNGESAPFLFSVIKTA